MNEPHPDARLDALFAKARAHRPDTSAAEFAFETRLMARLRERREAAPAWEKIFSWRLLPFIAAAVVVMAFWTSQVFSDVQDEGQIAYLQNSDAVDFWSNLN